MQNAEVSHFAFSILHFSFSIPTVGRGFVAIVGAKPLPTEASRSSRLAFSEAAFFVQWQQASAVTTLRIRNEISSDTDSRIRESPLIPLIGAVT